MAEQPQKPAPETPDRDDVPDVVLEELLAAFSGQDGHPIDFDDPSIDRLLGIGDSADSTVGNVDASAIDVESKVDSTTPSDATEALTSSNTVALVPPDKPARNQTTKTTGSSPVVKVIAIEDDDRPDALYLDEESGSRLREVHADDESGGRSTIIIKDLDESGSIEALPARSTGSMDPRVRARRIAVRRAKGRKRLIWVAIAAAILVVLVGAVAVLASSLFDVRTVDVQGAVYTDPGELSTIVDGLKGDAILLVDTRQVERQLETIAWVESARVSTEFPHDVFIDIRERKPIAAFAGSDNRFRVIDRDGRVLDVVDGVPIDYMLITGANPDAEPGQFAGRPFASASQLAIALPPAIRALTESIGVDATGGNLTLQLQNDLKVQLGPAADLSSKLVRLLSVVQGGLDGICGLDVSTPDIAPTIC